MLSLPFNPVVPCQDIKATMYCQVLKTPINFVTLYVIISRTYVLVTEFM